MIERIQTGQRMSQIVKHNHTVYLAGQVGDPENDITEQTKDCLRKIEALLAEAGSSVDQILQCTIWLANMNDFQAMNAVWDQWTAQGHAPARACGEAKLARKELKVEMLVTAAY